MGAHAPAQPYAVRRTPKPLSLCPHAPLRGSPSPNPEGGRTTEDLWKKYDQTLKELTDVKANNPNALARARARLVAIANQIDKSKEN